MTRILFFPGRFDDWWVEGVRNGWIPTHGYGPPVTANELIGEAFRQVALDCDTGHGGICRAANAAAADLADRLSEGCKPWATDEPMPDLRPLWETSAACRARPADYRAVRAHNHYRMPEAWPYSGASR